MRWFTYANRQHSHKESTWSKRLRPVRRHRYGYSSQKDPDEQALLFGTDDGVELTNDDLMTLARDEFLAKVMGGTYYLFPQENGTVVATPSYAYADLPDAADSNTPPLKIVAHGQIYEVDQYRRFNDCREMIKLSLGCAECPYKGRTCTERGLPSEALSQIAEGSHGTLGDEVDELFKHEESAIAGFTFASPMMTIPEEFTFTPKWRHVEEHDFSRIAHWKSVRGAGAKKSAEHRRFKRDQCKRCPIQKVCKDYRSCYGAYPSEEEMLKQTLEKWLPRIKKAPFEPWQFWALARGAGREGLKRFQRRHVMLSGLVWNDLTGFSAQVWYTKRPSNKAFNTTKYTDLTELFQLPKSKDDIDYARMMRPPEHDEYFMLWLLTLTERSKYKTGGWGSSKEIRIASRRLVDNGAEVDWSDNYGVWSTRYYGHDITDLNKLFSMVYDEGRLPFAQARHPGR